jgi:hypothetical protein
MSMNILRCLLIAFTPGLIAYLIGALVVAWPGGEQLIPLMAPSRFPHALAIAVTQIWLTSCGFTLALVGAFYEGKEWLEGRRA